VGVPRKHGARDVPRDAHDQRCRRADVTSAQTGMAVSAVHAHGDGAAGSGAGRPRTCDF
jgi:hypothetical protein